MAASVEFDRKEVQLLLEAERTKEVEARLVEEKKRRIQEQKTTRLQRSLLGVASIALLLTSGLGLTAFWQYRQAVAKEQEARISEIKALSSSLGLFASNQHLNALVAAIKAKRRLQKIGYSPQTEAEIQKILEQSVYSVDEFNQLSGHKGGVLGVEFSPNPPTELGKGGERGIVATSHISSDRASIFYYFYYFCQKLN